MNVLPLPFGNFSEFSAGALTVLFAALVCCAVLYLFPDPNSQKHHSPKKRPAGRSVFILLLLVMLAGAVIPPSAVRAEGSGITLGAGAITTENKVYFGTWNNKPVLWRVMGTGNNENGEKGMLLLSEYLLQRTQFNPDYNAADANVWQGSTAQSWCGDFYSGSFTTAEQSAVIKTSKNDAAYNGRDTNYRTSSLNGEYVFFLSAQEAETYFSRDDDDSRKGYLEDNPSPYCWWLRSPYANNTEDAAEVRTIGTVRYTRVSNGDGARPAFNLNLTSVLFSSEISSSSNQYKLTLKDTGITITASDAARSGNTVTVSSTINGTYNRVSVMMLDKEWADTAAVKYYGQLDSDGKFTLPSDYDPNWKTYLIAEQANDGNLTNYASEPVLLTITDKSVWDCGAVANTVTCTLDGDGKFTVSGTGAMADYHSQGTRDSKPWYDDRGKIISAVIEQGVTTIGNYAFGACNNLGSVSIPSSVTTIGNQAFLGCESLSSVTIPSEVTTIGENAFCKTSLSSVTIPSKVTTIGNQAFRYTPLSSVKIQRGSDPLSLGKNVFRYTHTTMATLEYTGEGSAVFSISPDDAGFTILESILESILSWSDPASETGEATLTVIVPSYTLNLADISFSEAVYGYTLPAAQAITITSIGDSDAVITSVTLGGGAAFTIDSSNASSSVKAGGTNTSYKIRPNSGLDAADYSDTITVTYNNNATATAKVSFKVNKAESQAQISDKAEVFIGGNTVALSKNVTGAEGTVTYEISGGTGGCSVDKSSGLFTSGDIAADYSVTVTVAESTNYKGKTGTIMVTVKEKNTNGLTVTQEDGISGQTLPAVQYNKPEGTKKESVTYSGRDGTDYTSSEQAPTAAGSYKVTVTCETADTVYTGSADFTIAAATYDLSAADVTFDAVNWGYTQPAAKAVKITSSGNSDAVISKAELSGDTDAFILNTTAVTTIAAGSTDETTYTVQPKAGLDADTYKATVTFMYNEGAAAAAEVEFTVNKDGAAKASKEPAAQTAENLIADGSAKDLLSDKGTAEGGTILFSVNGGAYSDDMPQGTDAGEYVIEWYIQGDTNHDDLGSEKNPAGTLTVVIGKGSTPVKTEFVFLKKNGSRGVPSDIEEQTLKPTIEIGNGSNVIAQSDPIEVELKGKLKTFSGTAVLNDLIKDLGPGKYDVSVKGLPKKLNDSFGEAGYKLSVKAEINEKDGETVITVYMIFKGLAEPEEPIVRDLPEDEIGSYWIYEDGRKEYLLFHTYEICMAWLGSDELCRGPERCYHK